MAVDNQEGLVMGTVIECDTRYLSKGVALGDIPAMGVPGFDIVPIPSRRQNPVTGEWRECEEYRLQVITERPAAVLRALKRLHPARTFRVLGEVR